MNEPTSFGLWLKQRRKVLDLTQADLGHCAGCSVATIRKIEADERRPSRQVAELLADCLEIGESERPTFLKVARAELRGERLGSITPAVPPPQPPAASEVPAASISVVSAAALPVPPTPLLGREHELATIGRLVQDPACRLLTLVGPGGIGKTRLALEAATCFQDLFDDGVYFAPLAAVNDHELIISAIADAVGFLFYGKNDMQTQLLHYLSEKAALLIIDNIEHLLPTAPTGNSRGLAFLSSLLTQVPKLKLLITSRERLNLQGEWLFEIQGLPTPPLEAGEDIERYSAAKLFLQRAQRAYVGFTLTPAERPAVAALCRLLDGMPLGLELAATWVQMLSVSEIVQEIERGLDFLNSTAHDLPERHRSLKATFDYSWQLLTVEEQRVMKSLSVFRGGFERAAAAVVAEAGLPLLSALMAKSLLRRTATGRYDLHELVRQYTADRLEADPVEANAARDRHTDYYFDLLHQQNSVMRSERQKTAVAELTAEIDNIRIAWEWGVGRQAGRRLQQAAFALQYFYELRNWYQEGEGTFKRAAEVLRLKQRTDRDQQIALWTMLTKQGYFAYRLGRNEQAVGLLSRSIDQLRNLDDQDSLSYALRNYGRACLLFGRYDEAEASLREAFELDQTLGRRWGMALCSVLCGIVGIERGDISAAATDLTTGLSISRSLGDPRLIVYNLTQLARTALVLNQYERAKAMLEESLALAEAVDDRFSLGLSLVFLGETAQAAGELTEAQIRFEESITLFQGIDDLLNLARAYIYLAHVELTLGNAILAQKLFTTAARAALEAPTPPYLLEALTGLAVIRAHQGDNVGALEWTYYILKHPLDMPRAKSRANQLQAELEARLTPDQVAAIQNQVQAAPFDQIIREAL